jgi:ArsR family transcriptional regulator
MVQRFKGLSDPIRLRIFYLLAAQGELCVCHLTDGLHLPQSTVSRHLSVLKQSHLIVSERKGKWVYYRLLDDDVVQSLAELISQHASSDNVLQKDILNISKITC